MARRLLSKRPFDFSARVPLQLGRESISSSTVAVSELIKNSYDADAEDVQMHFHLRNRPALSTIVLRDDGNGMSADTLYDHWLKIGTDYKFGVERSLQKQRVMTGAKGLGRLGLDRLCQKVVLYTKTENSNTVTQLIVDWRRYEGTNASISDIEHEVYEQDLPIVSKSYGDIFTSPNQKGTYMVLIGLKDYWDQGFLDALKEELRLLISPFRSLNDFKITLHRSLGDKKFKPEVVDSQELLAAASWEVKAVVDNFNRVSLSFTNNTSKEVVTQIPTPWKNWISNQGDKPLFGPLKLQFHYMVRKREFFTKVNMTATNWSKFMDMNRGVRIYRDDFRVRPYGEPSGKGDWLDIGFRKSQSPGGIRQGGWRIGPSQIIGAVSISKTQNKILNDQANREGIVENEAYLQLRTFVLKVIHAFELLAHKDAQDNEQINLADELEKTFKQSDEVLAEAIESINKTFSKKSKKKKKKAPSAQVVHQKLIDLKRAKASHEKAVNDYYTQLKKERKLLEEQKDTLSNLASIGILTVCFGHEIKNHSAVALGNARELLEVFEESKKTKALLDYEDLTEMTNDVVEAVKYVNSFSELAINNIKPDKRTRIKNNVPNIFEYITKLMSATFDTMGLVCRFQFVNIKRDEFAVRSFRIDWESIAINLITNSIWAVSRKPKNERKIIIRFERLIGKKLRLAFIDSGCGLETGQEEAIFLPMNSAKVDRTGNTIGTGMGLAIIKGQVEDHMSGKVYAKQFSSLGGAGFYIEVTQDS